MCLLSGVGFEPGIFHSQDDKTCIVPLCYSPGLKFIIIIIIIIKALIRVTLSHTNVAGALFKTVSYLCMHHTS